MKKTFIFILAGLSILACSKQSPVSVPEEVAEPGKYIFKLTASMSNEDETKTSYAGEKTFSWDANDEISVLFHNGETHKFFTLKTTAGGAAATFSGQIDEGYEIGASATEGGVKWALFPAGAHTWNTTNHAPNFNIPAVTDFTAPGAHFSTNIPMYAKGDGDNNFTFAHQACAYKFTFSNLDVSKVRLTVTHQTTHALSGDFNMLEGGKWYAKWADMASANRSVSYIVNVSAKTAVFYFCIGKDSESAFQPTITLTDEETGFILYRGQAKTAWGGSDDLKPLYTRIVILPSIPAPGAGVPFIPAFGINWSSLDMYPLDGAKDAFDGNPSGGIVEWKATSDASNIYCYYKIDKSKVGASSDGTYHWKTYIVTGFDMDNNDSTSGDGGYNLGNGYEARTTTFAFNGDTTAGLGVISGIEGDSEIYGSYPFSAASGSHVTSNGAVAGDYAYVELSIPRAAVNAPASGNITLRQSYNWYVTDRQTITLE